jgi:hypothetical protein
VEITPGSVRLKVGSEIVELANDYVFVFAGGVAPTALLERIGIRIGPHDLTEEAAREARLAAVAS